MLVLWTSQPPLRYPTIWTNFRLLSLGKGTDTHTHTFPSSSSGKNNNTNIVQKIDHVMMSFGYFCAPQCHTRYRHISKMHAISRENASICIILLYSKAWRKILVKIK